VARAHGPDPAILTLSVQDDLNDFLDRHWPQDAQWKGFLVADAIAPFFTRTA
jgi:hypothetical protein